MDEVELVNFEEWSRKSRHQSDFFWMGTLFWLIIIGKRQFSSLIFEQIHKFLYFIIMMNAHPIYSNENGPNNAFFSQLNNSVKTKGHIV